MTDLSAVKKIEQKTQSDYHICVGLDSDIDKIPKHLLKSKNPVFEFNKEIIAATKGEAGAYKLNLAFYEKEGKKGIEALEKTLELIPGEILTIGDAKRGDIGNTSKMYASSLFDHFGFDASTLHPYMGYDSVQPFLEFEDKLNFILVLTSNPGSSDFEKQKLENGRFLYQEVLAKVHGWNDKKNCGIVFGATQPQELKQNINLIGGLPTLLPGVGSQGGSLEDVVSIFRDAGSGNFLINVSRGLIYADNTQEFAAAAHTELLKLNRQVKEIKNKID